MTTIYHITSGKRWEQSTTARKYAPERFAVDCFIHCSTREQVIPVANMRFRGETGLVLLCIDTDKVTSEIIYENLEGGEQLYPHLYGELNNDAVQEVVEFPAGTDGHFTLPAPLVARVNSPSKD